MFPKLSNAHTKRCFPLLLTYSFDKHLTIFSNVLTCFCLQPVNNHCTAEGMARGYLYFKVDGDNTKYIECDPNTGSENIISCPSPRVWDMSVLSCVYDTQGGSGHFGAIPLDPNPCTSAAISAGHLYFPYMAQNQFIQCDNRGNAYINTCPFRFSWNAYLQTCFRPVF